MTYCHDINPASLPSLDGRSTRHLDSRQLACVAANVLAAPGPFRPTVGQLAAILHVSPPYIAVARRLPPAKRAAILAGTDKSSFTPLLNPPKPLLALPAPAANGELEDAALFAAVLRAGIDKTLAVAALVEAQVHH